MSTTTIQLADCSSLKQSLAALRAEHETYALFVTSLLADLEAMQQKLAEAETQIEAQNRELEQRASAAAVEPSPEDGKPSETEIALQDKVAELEGDRQALEDELETIRSRAVEMSEVIAEQKRQMAEDQSQWMAELRQLRRSLDKQIKNGSDPSDVSDSINLAETAPVARNGNSTAVQTATGTDTQHTTAQRTRPQGYSDPVLGSVLSQFELLQKDVARRRKQGSNNHTPKKPTMPDNTDSTS